MVTQKEIAEHAGVSRATVSRAFASSESVTAESLQKINATMKSLGLPELGPQEERLETRENYVLVMAGDISGHFFSPIIRGICDQLQSSGIHAVVCNSNYRQDVEEKQIRMAEANRYLGVILVSAEDRESLAELLRTVRIPVITVNRYLRCAETDVVCIDNYMGGHIAAQYLTEKGHTRIGHIASHQNSTPQEDRVRGFRDALKVVRADSQYKVYYGENSVERGYELASELIRQGMPHTALFVADYIIAIGIVASLRDQGYRVPEDVSILCFDDSPYISEVGLNLSTVQYDPDKIGREAVNVLLRRIGNLTDSKYHILLVPRLIERSSVLQMQP